MDDYEYLETELKDQVYTLMIDRPEVRNAVHPGVYDEISLALDEASQSEARVMVITGKGKTFSAGGDINWMKSTETSIQDSLDRLYTHDHIEQIISYKIPIICKVNGDAVGAGSTLATIGDIVVASEHARIGDPHVDVGYAAPDTPSFWPLLAGLNNAKELILTGDLISAKRAEEIGLVNHVVSDEQLEKEVNQIAEKLCSKPQHSLQGNKMLMNKWLQFWSNHIRSEAAAIGALHKQLDDHTDFVDDFLE